MGKKQRESEKSKQKSEELRGKGVQRQPCSWQEGRGFWPELSHRPAAAASSWAPQGQPAPGPCSRGGCRAAPHRGQGLQETLWLPCPEKWAVAPEDGEQETLRSPETGPYPGIAGDLLSIPGVGYGKYQISWSLLVSESEECSVSWSSTGFPSTFHLDEL